MRKLFLFLGLCLVLLHVSADNSEVSNGEALMKEASDLCDRRFYQKAEPKLKSALAQFQKGEMLDEELETLFLLEEVYDQLYLCGERQAVLDQLLDLTQTACGPAHPLTNKVHVRQADLYVDMGESKRGKEYLEPFEERFIEQKDYWSLASLQMVIGEFHQKRGRFFGARASFNQALEVCKHHLPWDYELEADILVALMVLNHRVGNFSKSLRIGNQQIELLDAQPNKSSRDSVDIGLMNMYLASTYSKFGNVELAIEYGDLAFSQFHQIPDLPISYKGAALFSKYSAYSGTGMRTEDDFKQLQQAIDVAFEAEMLLEKPTNRYLASYCHVNLLNIIRFLNYANTPENLARYNRALDLAQEWGIDPYLAMIVGAGIYWYSDDFQSALDLARKAQRIYSNEYGIENTSYGLEGISYLWMGTSHLRLMNMDSAAIYLQEAIQNFTVSFRSDQLEVNPGVEHGCSSFFLLGGILCKGWALDGLYAIHKDPKYLEMAHQTYLSGTLIGDSLRGEYDGESSKLELSGRSLAQHEGVIATGIKLYELTNDSSYLEQAFISSEKAKSLFLLEAQNKAMAQSGGMLPEIVENEIDSLQRELVLVNGELLNEKSYGEERDTTHINHLNQQRMKLNRQLRAWDERIEVEYPGYKKENGEQIGLLLQQVQDSLLGKNEAVLEYFIGTKELYTFFIDQNGLKAHRQPLPQGFDSLIGRFNRSISDYNFITDSVAVCFQEYIDLGQQLYQILLEPLVGGATSATKLTLILDGSLHQVPFEALLTSQVTQGNVDYLNLPYLLKEKSIHYAFSAASLLETQGGEQEPEAIRCLALAPGYEGGTGQTTRGDLGTLRSAKGKLAGAQREVKAIAELDVEGEFLFGEMATEKSFKSMASDYGLLHVAMHGQADNNDPMRSSLVFSEIRGGSAEDHLLHAYELDAIPFKADLVVLSACESGVGRFVPGEGAMSLGRSFVANGAKSVVTTLWKVEDESSSTLMSSFYTHLVEGIPTGEALRQAKLKQLAGADSRTAHPYFWAGYISNGASKKLNFSKQSQWKYWLVGGVLLLGLALLFRLTPLAGRSTASESD